MLIMVAGALLPAEDHVVFLIPAAFRGEVALACDEGYANPLPRDGHEIVLTVPPGGRLSTSDAPDKRWLANADFYLVDAAGHRLRQLRPLDDAAFDRNLRPTETRAEGDRQEVGVFPTGLYYKRPRGASDEATPPGSFPPKEVPYLAFTVSCYDSLETDLHKAAF